MLNSGKKTIRALRDKKKYILTLMSENKFLNEAKNHNPPSPPFKLNGRSLMIATNKRYVVPIFRD